jgi:signal transduction histidine kinase
MVMYACRIDRKDLYSILQYEKSGSGIGLSLCKQIMMLHKGNIQVQSIEGEGTAFLLQF